MNLLQSKPGRRLLFASLYLAEGAPMGYVWWALPTKLRAAGVPHEQITLLTATATLPWTLKFFWAPLIDTFTGPRLGYRVWITAAQLAMGITLIPLIGRSPVNAIGFVTTLLIVHAFFAATQDVAVDAFCILSIDENEHGSINGWMQFGMLLGRSIFGGAIHKIESMFGQELAMSMLIACIWLSTILIWFAKEPPKPDSRNRDSSPFEQFYKRLRQVFLQKSTWVALLFAATGAAALEAVGFHAGPLLIDIGLTEIEGGQFKAITVVVSMALGALFGGRLADRYGHHRTVKFVGIALAMSSIFLAFLLYRDTVNTLSVRIVLAIIYFTGGAFTASTYALFMDATDPELGATQFSTFMGVTNLCETWVVWATGYIIAMKLVIGIQRNYAIAFFAAAIITILALLLVSKIKRPIESENRWLLPSKNSE